MGLEGGLFLNVEGMVLGGGGIRLLRIGGLSEVGGCLRMLKVGINFMANNSSLSRSHLRGIGPKS